MANNKANAPVIVLIILLIISLSLAGIIFYSLRKEQIKTLSFQQELEGLRAKYLIVEKELQDSKNSAADLESQLKNSDILINELKTKLESEKSESAKILDEKEKIQSDLEQQKQLRGELESKYMNLLEQNKKALRQIEELTAEKSELEKKIQTIESAGSRQRQEEGIELGRIVVGPESEETIVEETVEEIPVEQQQTEQPEVKTEPPEVKQEIKQAEQESVKTEPGNPALESKVLVVNKEHGFAVIDIGSSQGVKLDDIFCVYQGKRYIGDLKIEKVHESMSAAGFLNKKVKDRINEGDSVILKKK